MKKTHEKFQLEVKEIVGNEYSVLSEYKNTKTKIKMRHNNVCEHEWYVRPSDFLRGTRCPVCSRKKAVENKTLGNEEFKKRVVSKLGDEFEIGQYINKRTKVHLKHNKCGYEWSILPSNIYKLKGCPKCLGNRRNKTTNDFKSEVLALTADEYTVLGRYKGANTKILMRHNICKNEYSVAPYNFLSGRRCPICSPKVRMKKLIESGYDFTSKSKGTSKYNVNIGDIYGYWIVLDTFVHSLEGKDKNRNAYNNALCLCTKCNKNTNIISYSRLVKTKDSRMCKECAGNSKRTTNNYINELSKKNPLAKLKEGQIYINNRTNLIHICSSCGKEYKTTPEIAIRGKHLCRKCSYLRQGCERTKTTEEYIQELATVNKFVKLKDGEKYITCDIKINHICSVCGNDWLARPSQVLTGHIMCNSCARKYHESIHATLIKQVYKYHYKESLWEERIYINNGENYCDIDIVNHARKEAVEIDGVQHQRVSGWHKLQAKRLGVTPEEILKQQQIRDMRVNEYFEKIGYRLIRINIEKLSPLEALQQLFPEYKSIPDWVDFSNKKASKSWDVSKAQELLNQYTPMSVIARTLGVSQALISKSVKNNVLIKPKEYLTLNERAWDINIAQQMLNEYISYKEIREKLNISEGSFRHALYCKKLILPSDYKKRLAKNEF